MKRLSGLTDIDPLSIPLPHGTEVTTRVERQVNGRHLPQGLPGRVVRSRDGGVDVLIAGVGEIWFARTEVVPRKAGQIEFAQRREEAWTQLSPCRVLEATVGSRAWGLADDSSDTDLRGAFVLPFQWTAGLVEPPSDLVSADGSQTFWEARKLVQQALRADPNTLELLFVPSVRALDELGAWLLAERDAFVSRLMFGSFGRYALSQLDKLASSQRLAETRDVVLSWLSTEPELGLDEVARRLAELNLRAPFGSGDPVTQTKTYIKQLYRSLADQGLIESNDFEAMRRYAQAGGKRPAAARELRPKNAYNLLRLIELAEGWLRTGAPVFEASGDFRARLFAIKSGAVPLAEVLAEAEAMSTRLEAARDGSPLPEQPDYRRADALVRRIASEVARRHVAGVSGPWGRDSPPAPVPLNPEET